MKIKSITMIKILLAAIIIAFSFNNSLFAQGKDKRKAITGEVSAISKDFIAIVYNRNQERGSEEEIALPLAKNVIIEHKKSLSEIAVGDMVSVEFEEMSESDERGGERTKRTARVLSFVRAAPKKTESAILDSANPPEEKE